MREFQTLGRVKRHKQHPVIGLPYLVDIGDQRHFFQKFT